MLKSGERQVGELDQRVCAEPGVVADPHQVEGPVAWITTRAVNGPMLPRLDPIAHQLLRPACPRQRAGREPYLSKMVFTHSQRDQSFRRTAIERFASVTLAAGWENQRIASKIRISGRVIPSLASSAWMR
jgi:hypothetical protein